MADRIVVCTALYDDVSLAQSDLEALEKLHHEGWLGPYDAAVVDRENGRPHVVQRAAQPGVRLIPDLFGSGTLPREELHEAASELTWQAGLIAVGDPPLARGFELAVTRANEVTTRSLDAGVADLTREVEEAFTPQRAGRGADDASGGLAAVAVPPPDGDQASDAAVGVPGVRPSR